MSKFDRLKLLKQTKARANHSRSRCGLGISKGETFFCEHLTDMFLRSLHAKKFCAGYFENTQKR